MGIDFHVHNFLKYINLSQEYFGNTLTIGRQNFVVAGLDFGPFCEDFLISNFKATKVESIDISNFEGASIIQDLNMKVPKKYHTTFDTIIDAGSLEHIYNIKQAFQNIASMLKNGGQVIHISPTNGFSGHGLYQFSYDLFANVYNKENGFINFEVFVEEVNDLKAWYRVLCPEKFDRVNIYGVGPVYMMVRAVKHGAPSGEASIQQTDYSFHWSGETPQPRTVHNELNKEWSEPPGGLMTKVLKKIGLVPLSSLSNLRAEHPLLEKLSIIEDRH